MKIINVKFVATVAVTVAIFAKASAAFVPQSSSQHHRLTMTRRTAVTASRLSAHHNSGQQSIGQRFATAVSHVALAGTILATSLTMAPPDPSLAATTTYDLSTGAIVINTSSKPGQSILKAEVDLKNILSSAFANRRALKQSVDRISLVVKEELSGPAWKDLVRQVLQTEQDVTPDIDIMPPNDLQQLLRDVANGRLNLIVNGELINLEIDETSTKDTDEVVIRAKGVKGIRVVPPAQMIAKTRLQEQFEALDSFWNGEFQLGDGRVITTPQGLTLTNGLVFGGGTMTTVILAYVVSYAYYTQQQDNAAKEAEARRQAVAAKKAAAAAKAKTTASEDEE